MNITVATTTHVDQRTPTNERPKNHPIVPTNISDFSTKMPLSHHCALHRTTRPQLPLTCPTLVRRTRTPGTINPTTKKKPTLRVGVSARKVQSNSNGGGRTSLSLLPTLKHLTRHRQHSAVPASPRLHALFLSSSSCSLSVGLSGACYRADRLRTRQPRVSAPARSILAGCAVP